MDVRLQKHIADLGICSRRKAEELIRLGKVTVNGTRVTEMGVRIDPEKDRVQVDGASMQKNADHIYIAMHKPTGYITSTTNEQGASVLDLFIPEHCVQRAKRQEAKQATRMRVFPVGRLDKDSEGLVLLTNDGELTNILTHPKYEHEKEYDAVIMGHLGKDVQRVLTKGMRIGKEQVEGIEIKKLTKKGKQSRVTVVLKEGKNRQIRRMFGALGHDVLSLKRTKIGNLALGSLSLGKWKFVKKNHIV